MDFKFPVSGDRWAGLIAVLLIVIVVILVLNMQQRERTIGDKVQDAVEELQK